MTPSPQTTPLREGVAQCSLFPVRCKCGIMPVVRDYLDPVDYVVFCFCGIEVFETVEMYNAWAMTE